MTQTMITVPKVELATLKAIITAKHKWLSEEYKHVFNLLSVRDKQLQLIHGNIKEYISDANRFQHRMIVEQIPAKTIERKGFLGMFSKTKIIPEQKKVTYRIATPGDVRKDVKNHVLRTMEVSGYLGTIKKVTVEETHWSRMCPPCPIIRSVRYDYISIDTFNGTCNISVEIGLSEEHLKLRSRLSEVISTKTELDDLLNDLDMAAQCDRDIFMPLEKYVRAKAVKE